MMVQRALLALALLPAAASAAGQAPEIDPAAALVLRLEAAAAAGDGAAILALARSPDTPGIQDLATISQPAPSRVVIKERDRSPLEGAGERLLLEILTEFEREAVITTWRVDVEGDPASLPDRLITRTERLSVVSGLHRLGLDPAQQFDVRNLTLRAVDLTIEIPSGSAFVAETLDGPTAVVLLGRGRMHFAPSDPAERTQVRIFSGKEILTSDFDAAFVRLRPSDFSRLFGTALVSREPAPRQFRRAEDVFEAYVGETFHLDLTDLSRERWSLVPGPADLVVEVRTRRHGSLTYARSSREAEDISLFDRRRRRNISVYASPQKLASRGRFYSEDDLADYDILRHEIDAAFTPDRLWLDGNARVRLRVRAYGVTSLTLRLANSLAVRSVGSPELGRLLHLRIIGQNSVIVNFPEVLPRDAEITLHVVYGGRLEPQQIDREGIAILPQNVIQEQIYIPIEPHYIYSNRSYWYPQGLVTDYATARMRLTIPSAYDVVATGTSAGPAVIEEDAAGGSRKIAVFDADSPARYLACVISRFEKVSSRELSIPAIPPGLLTDGRAHPPAEPPLGDASHSVDLGRNLPEAAAPTLDVLANPRQVGRAGPLADRAAAIFEYYAALIGDAPYPGFTLAVAEHALPGGHSPAYFAILNQPPPLAPMVWRNDPVVFEGYPPFFLAHEIAHQWWGQAVGWKNYHEQWLSEGFAQYFTVLYATSDRGDELQASMFRQMRRWAMEQSAQGPIYLGYRLGHIRGEGRVFRALLYNKGAMVLHMLRRLLGDEVFFAGIRDFYAEWKFRKAGTDDLRQAMEAASGADLTPFFEAWIYGSAVPSLRFAAKVAEREAVIRFEHSGDVIPVPVTVSVIYTDRRTEDFVVAVTEPVVERTLPLTGSVRSIEVNRDHAAVADVSRQRLRFGVRPGLVSPAQGR